MSRPICVTFAWGSYLTWDLLYKNCLASFKKWHPDIEVRVFGDKDYDGDVSRAVMTVLHKGISGTVYNIGTCNEYSVNEIFETIREIIGHGTKVHVEDRPHNDKRYAVDSEALKNLGWSEQVPFDVAIQKTVEWYMTNRTWYLK